jgi:hypothetical protein
MISHIKNLPYNMFPKTSIRNKRGPIKISKNSRTSLIVIGNIPG